jgi:hypothetical protein
MSSEFKAFLDECVDASGDEIQPSLVTTANDMQKMQIIDKNKTFSFSAIISLILIDIDSSLGLSLKINK